MCMCVSLHLFAVYMTRTGRPLTPLHSFMTVKRCTAGEEVVRGKEADAWLFTLGLSSLSCHRSSEM